MKQIPSDPDMPVYRVERGKQIDFEDYSPSFELRPIACAVKADGSIKNEPSFAFVVEFRDGINMGRTGVVQVSLEMLRPAIRLANRMKREQ